MLHPAHFSDDPNIKDQTWLEHAEGVTDLMLKRLAEANSAVKLSEIARYCGMTHDLGKQTLRWSKGRRQDFSTKPNGTTHSYPHQAMGFFNAMYKCLGPLVYSPIAAHHGGLKNGEEWSVWGDLAHTRTNDIMSCHWEDCLAAAEAEYPALKMLHNNVAAEVNAIPNDKFTQNVICHYLTSLLIDSDCLDTESYYNQFCGKTIREQHDIPDWGHFYNLLLLYQNKVKGGFVGGDVHSIRDRLFSCAVNAAGNNTGFFMLPAPTGTGKTLAMLAWAFLHAKKHNKLRVILVAPFITIVKQISDVLRQIDPNMSILEDHSTLEFADDVAKDRSLMSKDNWGPRVIVTTSPQFLDSMFSGQGGRIRKIHSIANSVVVFDEAHGIPASLLPVTMKMLNCWHDLFDTSFLMASATLPVYDTLVPASKLRWIDPQYKSLFSDPSVRRVSATFPKNMDETYSFTEIAQKILMEQDKQVMCITNTREESYLLYEAVKDMTDNQVFLLNTLMPQVRRVEVLRSINRLLREKKPCYLISTSVVEAGIDLDFPVGYRFLSSYRSMLQASGRVNRNGVLKAGRFVVIIPKGGVILPPGEIEVEFDVTKEILDKTGWNPDIYDVTNLEMFWSLFQGRIAISSKRSKKIIKAMEAFEHSKVTEEYKVISNYEVNVIVPHGKGIEYIRDIRTGKIKPSRLLRHTIAPYCIQLDPEDKNVSTHNEFFYVWNGGYDTEVGINAEKFSFSVDNRALVV